MEFTTRIEQTLASAVASVQRSACPPQLAAAVRYAVFPGGARIRPKLCLAVAAACGDDAPGLSDAAAAAVELLHCASLVHDDLPCFDNAATRRGVSSLHRAFNERLAVLTGDGLIVLAFETLARAAEIAPARLPQLISTIAQGVGMPLGIVAGQAWENEPQVVVADYHLAKTGALFIAATVAGAVAAGADPTPWRRLGQCIGEAYQIADDLHDVTASSEDLGKPVGQDAALGRPNAVRELGITHAAARLKHLVSETIESIPNCMGAEHLRNLVLAESKRFFSPKI